MGGGQYIMTGKDSNQNPVVMFSLPEKVGALAKALKVFEVSSNEAGPYSQHLTFFATTNEINKLERLFMAGISSLL